MSTRIGALLAFGSVALVAGMLLLLRPNPARGLVELIEALRLSDEAAFSEMSERYRDTHELSDFRRAVARLSELRSASSPTAPPWGLLERRDEARFCCTLPDVENARLHVHMVWQGGPFGGGWQLDRLSIEGRQFDQSQPTDVRCSVTR